MLTIDATASSSTHSSIDDSVDKYLPEPQSFKAVLKLNDDIQFTWLHAINMEFKSLNDHDTFELGQEPDKNKLIIPFKQVLKNKHTPTGTRLEKLKARLVARGDIKKRKTKKTRAAFQKQKQQKRQENAKNNPARTSKKTNTTIPIEIPQPFENTWSSCATLRGVKLLLLCFIFFVNKMLYVGSNDTTKQKFKTSVRNRVKATFLGPAQRFLQMHSHQQTDTTHILDQNCFVLKLLQRYNPKSEFPERETPPPTDFTFSKDNRPVTDHDKRIIEKQHKHQPFRSTVWCMLLYLAYNTQADINSAFCKPANACIHPGNFNFRALTIWLIGFLQQRPYNAAKFYADGTSKPVHNVCRQHCIPHTNFTSILSCSDASWLDCPNTGHSTIRYMIFYYGILMKANSTIPTPIAMSSSDAKYLAACSTSMANPHHICMLLYNMTYLGTQQWHESTQCLPPIASFLMKDNEAIVQIACTNGKLTCKACHIKRHSHYVLQDQQDSIHQLHWIPCVSQFADILKQKQTNKTQVPLSKTDLHIDKILCTLPDHMLQPTNKSTEI
jgi:hypothetical protein